MKRSQRWFLVAMIFAGLQLVACTQATGGPSTKIEPAMVELIPGTKLNRVVLTERAAQRLDIQTTPLRDEQVKGAQRKLVPYAALLYGLNGETWIYTSPAPLTYVREAITVDYIDGDTAVLLEGPPVDTAVVMVGVAELYGTDTGIGK